MNPEDEYSALCDLRNSGAITKDEFHAISWMIILGSDFCTAIRYRKPKEKKMTKTKNFTITIDVVNGREATLHVDPGDMSMDDIGQALLEALIARSTLEGMTAEQIADELRIIADRVESRDALARHRRPSRRRSMTMKFRSEKGVRSCHDRN